MLELLFDNRDRVVPKDELFDALWQGRIVSDGALTTAVNELRHALGDTGKSHQISRTFCGQDQTGGEQVDPVCGGTDLLRAA
ncbi:MAG: winged helix-turn-helix domain-containing protein [Pseudomonadota bacterium]